MKSANSQRVVWLVQTSVLGHRRAASVARATRSGVCTRKRGMSSAMRLAPVTRWATSANSVDVRTGWTLVTWTPSGFNSCLMARATSTCAPLVAQYGP